MPRLIKKYKNRRLYDTKLSRYITIEELQSYVIDKIEFKVEDASSAEDLTRATLLQILVELESSASKFLSADALKQLILLANHPLAKSFNNMVEQFLSTFEQSNASSKLYQDLTTDLQKNTQTWFQNWEKLFKAEDKK